MLTYSNGVYVCDDARDMVRVRAKKGDIAKIGRETYRYNGGSWTKLEDAVKGKVQCGEFERCNTVTQKLDTTPCFDNPPYYVDFLNFDDIGTAMQAAWLNDERRVWLNGKHIDGKAETGDTLEVHGKKWHVAKIFYYTDKATGEHCRRYLLERVTNPAAYVKAPKLRTLWT